MPDPKSKPGPYKRVKGPEVVKMLLLADAGESAAEIARRLGRSTSTVTRTLDELTADSREAARKLLNSKAFDVADSWVKTARRGHAGAARDILLHNETIKPVAENVGSRILIQVGTIGHPVPLPDSSDTPALTVTPIRQLETAQVPSVQSDREK